MLSTTTKVSARASRRSPSSERLLGGSLGAPWAVLGGPRGVPGRSQAPIWAPRSDPDNKGAHSGGSQGESRSVENLPESVFLRSQEGKCVYFQRFKHVHFVDLMWPLGAPGPALGGFGEPWERQGWSWGGPGGRPGGNDPPLGRSRGSRGTGCRPQGSLGGPSNAQMSVLERSWFCLRR